MKIVDFRPRMVRRFTRPDSLPSAPGLVSRWLGGITDRVIKRRVLNRPSPTDKPLLVSVGNLALGGTGKTPVVISLAQGLAAEGLRGVILTRGYGSSLPGPLLVQADDLLAGDEARMMAGVLAELSWPVVQSRNRPLGLRFIEEEKIQADVILLEDAHQTEGLPRHIDLLILDPWRVKEKKSCEFLEPATGDVFPLGPWRESSSGARRAAAILVEGSEATPARSILGQPVFAFERSVGLRNIQGSLPEGDTRKWALVSGIARPERFEVSARQCLGDEPVLSVRCRDHARFSPRLVQRILREMESSKAEGLITTGKDWVKLSAVWNDERPVMVLDLNLIWRGKENALIHWLAERI